MTDFWEGVRTFWGILVDHFPSKLVLSALTGTVVSLFGPIDIVMRAFAMALVLSLFLMSIRYLQVWMDPELNSEDMITKHAQKWSQRWVGYLLIAGMGYQMSILLHVTSLRDGFMAFGVISEFAVMLAVLEEMMGISLDPLRQKLQVFFGLIAFKRKK